MSGAGSILKIEPDALPPAGEVAVEQGAAAISSAMELLNSYAPIFLVAFAVTILLTPLCQRLAHATGIIDRPDQARKSHGHPVAYLGGVAVFFGLVTAVAVSYVTVDRSSVVYAPMPVAVVVGMAAIMFTGLADDIWGWDPRLKIAGQLVAAAALAMNDVGVRVAEGMLNPLLGPAGEALVNLGGLEILNGHLYYWTGTALIAVFVLGGCNAANLIDGLDGLLSGVSAIVALGLLSICLLMATHPATGTEGLETLAGARIVLCLALLGAVLGFLPHNFNPATIFLGDCGSLLIGFMCVVIILMIGEHGQTHLVFAGLIVFAVPIMDTTLAMIRRWLAGTSMSSADDQHMHHQLRRTLGGVKRAVLALYGISALFATLGVGLAWLVMCTELRVRLIYVITIVLFSSVGVIAVKAARRRQRLAALAGAPEGAPPPAAAAPRRVERERSTVSRL